MSAELRLLDDLTGDDVSLYYAWRLFGGNAEALDQARHSLTMQARDGLIEVVHKANGNIQTLVEWQVREVFADEANWLKQCPEAEYFLRLTQAGEKYFCG